MQYASKLKRRDHHSADPVEKQMKIMVAVLALFSLSFFFFFFSLLMGILEPENLYGSEYEVRVINGFTSNSSLPLVIWCASDDVDLGGRALQENDDFGWKINVKFWVRIHFWCTMKWDRKRKTFDAFKVPRDAYRCRALRKCSWLVREDGFYFSSDEVAWNKDFQWH